MPFDASASVVPVTGSRAGVELADLGDRDQMAADELDRRVEAVGVLALVGVVERALDRLDRGRVDRAVGSATSTPCSWFS